MHSNYGEGQEKTQQNLPPLVDGVAWTSVDGPGIGTAETGMADVGILGLACSITGKGCCCCCIESPPATS